MTAMVHMYAFAGRFETEACFGFPIDLIRPSASICAVKEWTSLALLRDDVGELTNRARG